MESNIKEQLETAIAAVKCVRSFYEAEVSTYVHETSSSLPRPEDMIRYTGIALGSFYHALGNVVREQSRNKES